MRKIMQFRYYGNNNNQNYPRSDMKFFDNGNYINILENYGIVKQLGIQTLPGVQFRINSTSELDWITIGSTGIYELDLEDLIEIETIHFHKESIELIDAIPSSLIVDIIYDDMEGVE